MSSFVTDTVARVRSLREGVEYEFSVQAENSYGISDRLTTDQAVQIKSPYGKPFISLYTIIV